MDKIYLAWDKINILFYKKGLEAVKMWIVYDEEIKKNKCIFIECLVSKNTFETVLIKIPNSKILLLTKSIKSNKIISCPVQYSDNQKELLKFIYPDENELRYSLITNTEIILYSTVKKDTEKFIIQTKSNNFLLNEMGEIKITLDLSFVKNKDNLEVYFFNEFRKLIKNKTLFYQTQLNQVKNKVYEFINHIEKKTKEMEKKNKEYDQMYDQLLSLKNKADQKIESKLSHRNLLQQLFTDYNKISNELSIINGSVNYLTNLHK